MRSRFGLVSKSRRVAKLELRILLACAFLERLDRRSGGPNCHCRECTTYGYVLCGENGDLSGEIVDISIRSSLDELVFN